MTMTFNEARLTLQKARNKDAGKPLQNNTRLYDRGFGEHPKYAVRLHNTDVVVINEDHTYAIYSGGYTTITTLDRIRTYSPAKLFSVKGEWYVSLEPDPSDPEPDYQNGWRKVPKPYEALNPGPEPEKDPDNRWNNAQYLWYSQMHGRKGYAIYAEMMEKFGTQEAWQEAYITDFRERKQWLKDRREWDERNRVPFYDGIIVNSEGYVPRDRKTGPSAKKLKAHERKVAKIKQQINKFVKDAVNALAAGLPMPSGGDCWYCALSSHDGVPMGDAMDTLHSDGTMTVQPSHDHLWSHIEEKYYVPSMFVNALRERGYQDTGVYLWLEMNPDINRMGGPRLHKDTITRDLRKYLYKRLIPAAPTK